MHISGPKITTVPTKLGKGLFITDQLELRLSAKGVKHCFDKKKDKFIGLKIAF